MAFVAVNPKVVGFGGTRVALERDTLPIADSQTWKQGEFGIFSGGTLNVAASNEIPTHIFREDRDTADDDTNVEVDRIAIGTLLEMYCSAAVGIANLFLTYDLTVGSNIHTVNLSATTDQIFRIVELAATYEPERNSTSDNPGKCIVEVMRTI